MNVVIIEDELFAQEELKRLLKIHFPGYNVLKNIQSVDESVRWFSSNKADLVFMDIQLSDGSCFDIFKEIEMKEAIIFTTAYDQFAIQAFQVNGIGYLLKPIDENEFIKAVKKFESLGKKIDVGQLLETLQLPKKNFKTRVLVKSGDRYRHIEMDEIAYFVSEDKVSIVVSVDGRRNIIDQTLDKLESELDPQHFFRITRGCIASIHSIGNVSKYFAGRLKVTLKPNYDNDLLISRVKVSDFLHWLGG